MAFAGQGTVQGTVTEMLNGNKEPLPFANVAVIGNDGSIVAGSTTDMLGQFSFKIEEGDYKLESSFAGYETQRKDITIVAGQTLNMNFEMSEGAIDLSGIEIEVELAKDNDQAILLEKKKSTKMLDGISAATMELTQDGTAAEAAQRVTGVTIEGGKYVYVRGLGDRYSKTTLNGMDISGLDPDRNSLQMDIFPSSLIANMMVSKNFTADMPADFTGGIMNVETKDLPEYKIMSISLGTGYNPGMHFNDDWLTYEGGQLDFLGMDDGTRAIPDLIQQNGTSDFPAPFFNTDEEVQSYTSSFNPTLGATNEMSLLDLSGSFTLGNQIDLSNEENKLTKNPRLGYIMSVSYKSDYKYYDRVEYGEYQRVLDPNENELVLANLQTGSLGERSFLLGGMAGLAYKTKKNKIRLTAMRLQSGQSEAGQFRIVNNSEAVGQSGYNAGSTNLQYSERSLTNILLNGQHKMKDKGWNIDWRISPTMTVSDDPDIRKTAFTYFDTDTVFAAGDGGMPSRIWRELNEISLPAKIDFTKDFMFRGFESKFLFGASHIRKSREYEINLFNGAFFGQSQNWNGTDPNQVLDPANIFPNGNDFYYQSGNANPNPNAYTSVFNNSAGYVSAELGVSTRLKAILGLRAENFVQTHTGRDMAYASGDTIGGRNLVDAEVLNSFDLFPTANVIYAITDKQNLRAAFSKTIARPSFKELSFAQIIDPLTNRTFNGALFQYYSIDNGDTTFTWNGNLTETRIFNYDVRWEFFGERGETVSASLFYKSFDNPIEMVRIPEQQTTTEFQPRNVGDLDPNGSKVDGQVLGFEFEFKKDFSFISEKLTSLKANGNITVVQSTIEMSDQEYDQRKAYEKSGETIDNKREMAGQSPYVINGGFTYELEKAKLNIGAFYNVKGPTLYIVGGGLFPDIYSDPFHSLSLSANKKFGEEGRTMIDFKVSNLLNDDVYFYYSSFGAQNQTFSLLSPGMSFSFGFKHKF